MRFRRRLLSTIEAVQWTGDNLDEVRGFAGQAASVNEIVGDRVLLLRVAKSHSLAHLQCGDWVIAESDGHGFYPCEAKIFAATYEPADEVPE